MIYAKDKIAEKFVDLCNKKDINKLSVSNICDELEISRTTFYKHFKDKYDLMNYIYVLDKKQAFSLEQEHKSFKDTTVCMLQLMKEKKSYYINIMNDVTQTIFLDFVYSEVYKDYMKSTFEQKEITDYQKNIIMFSAAGITNLFRKWIVEGMKKDPEQAVDEIYSILPEYMLSLDKR